MDFRKSFNDKIILVTGGAGAIGSNLSRTLAEAGAAKVIILDDLSASYSWNIPNLPNVLFVKGSITNDVDRDFEIDLSFLKEGIYEATIYADHPNFP